MQGFDKKRTEVYYTSSEQGATQTHLGRVDLKGRAELLHLEAGTHRAAYSNSFNYYIHTHHTADTPPVYTLRNKAGKGRSRIEEQRSH